MSIKEIYEQSIRALEAERKTVADRVIEQVRKEKILPFNQEINQARDLAIAEKQEILNEAIVQLQNKFAEERKEIIDATENRKQENENAVITTETYAVTVEYDKAIAKLKDQIANLK